MISRSGTDKAIIPLKEIVTSASAGPEVMKSRPLKEPVLPAYLSMFAPSTSMTSQLSWPPASKSISLISLGSMPQALN